MFFLIYSAWTEEVRGVERSLLQLALKEVEDYYPIVIHTIGDFIQ